MLRCVAALHRPENMTASFSGIQVIAAPEKMVDQQLSVTAQVFIDWSIGQVQPLRSSCQ